jgi:hypothetical protein
MMTIRIVIPDEAQRSGGICVSSLYINSENAIESGFILR